MPGLRQALAGGAARLREAGLAHAEGEAERLLLAALRRDRAFLFAHPEAGLDAAQQARFDDWIARRAAHEPPQYLTGEQEFRGRAFRVTPDVLIPRPETELVAEAALALLPAGAGARVADVGTGSGCLAITLALERPAARVLAIDRSRAALAVARDNARRLGAQLEFSAGDLLGAVRGPCDLIVSNPPYVSDGEWAGLEPEVRDHEPRMALAAGPTGLEIYIRLIPQAAACLRPGGWLVLELGHDSAPGVRALLAGWEEVSTQADPQGHARALTARR